MRNIPITPSLILYISSYLSFFYVSFIHCILRLVRSIKYIVSFRSCKIDARKDPSWIRIDTKPRLRGFIPPESGEFFIKLARFIGPISPRIHRAIVGESSRWKSIPRGGNSEEGNRGGRERVREGEENVFLSPRKVWPREDGLPVLLS